MKSLIVIFVALTLCLSIATPGRGAFCTTIIQSFSFDPPTRTITAGDTVVWVNLDGVGHTVTGDFEKEPICGSGFLYQGGVCMRTFNTVGTFTYHCEPHESMVGSIVVDPSTSTNYVNVHPEYKTNLSSTNWLALTVRSNRLVKGALETFCGQPTGNSVFIRIRSVP